MFFALNATVILTFDLVTSKCIGVIYWPWPNFLPSTMTVTQKLFKILSGHEVANGRTDGRTVGRTPYHNTSEVSLRRIKNKSLQTQNIRDRTWLGAVSGSVVTSWQDDAISGVRPPPPRVWYPGNSVRLHSISGPRPGWQINFQRVSYWTAGDSKRHTSVRQATRKCAASKNTSAGQAAHKWTAIDTQVYGKRQASARRATSECTASDTQVHGKRRASARQVTHKCTASDKRVHGERHASARQATHECTASDTQVYGKRHTSAGQTTRVHGKRNTSARQVRTQLQVKGHTSARQTTHECTAIDTRVHEHKCSASDKRVHGKRHASAWQATNECTANDTRVQGTCAIVVKPIKMLYLYLLRQNCLHLTF